MQIKQKFDITVVVVCAVLLSTVSVAYLCKDYRVLITEFFEDWDYPKTSPRTSVKNFTESEGNYFFEIYETSSASSGFSAKTSRNQLDMIKYTLFFVARQTQKLSLKILEQLARKENIVSLVLIFLITLTVFKNIERKREI